MLIREKVEQAVEILREQSVDCWITFVRETSMLRDPMLSFLHQSDLTWYSAFIVTRDCGTHAIVGDLEKPSVEDVAVFDQVQGYVKGIRQPLLETIKKLDPATIAVNYSKDSEIADGLTHGMYLTLYGFLSELGFQDRIVSSEKIASSLRARKTEAEVGRMQRAVDQTQEIFARVAEFIRPGKSEAEIANFMKREAEARKLELAWDETHCPGVFTGPDAAGAHYHPTDRNVERGHILNMDFGIKVEGYCSDLQRTFYVLEDGEAVAPEKVMHGFETIVTAIDLALRALKPGVQGKDVDAVAREHIVSRGYAEYPHALGHQVGQFAHDGTGLLGPAWERYGGRPFEPIEAGMVFTLEPRLTVEGKGVVTIEEMAIVRDGRAELMSDPQKELMPVR